MAINFYRQGFLEKIASYKKFADYAATQKIRQAIRDENEPIREKPEPHVQPTTFGGTLRHYGNRALTNLKSLGIGTGSALGVAGIRLGQGAIDLATFVPKLADSLVMGKMLGIDEGRGLFGRAFGKLNRYADRGVHKLRQYSSNFDENHRIDGKFNRFLNGVVADTAGSFLGWGGLKRGLAPKFWAGFGAYDALSPEGAQAQLRNREAWIRSLDPKDRWRVDATSTAYNQKNAPTRDEYKRYHQPSQDLPTSSSGKIRVPYNWMHQSNEQPVNFRDFGT